MDAYWDGGPRVSTEFTYRGIETALLENDHLRVMVLPGKGGDILEFRDKRTDTDVLWHAQHNWQSPAEGYIPPTGVDSWMAYWPGGWQVNLPIAGWGGTVGGVDYGTHGESALIPWDATVTEASDDAVALQLTTELATYPIAAERTLRLPAEASRLEISESLTNRGDTPVEYIWQQHIALGRPLIGPAARFDIPAQRGLVDPTYDTSDTFEHGRLDGGATFEWPHAPAATGGTVDLREFPPPDVKLHDQAYALELEAGWYAVSNPAIDLGFGVQFPRDPFECVWYWQAFGGFEESPFFGRNYNVGIEPTSAYPAGSIPEVQRENGTINTLEPGADITAELAAPTFEGRDRVEHITPDGTVR